MQVELYVYDLSKGMAKMMSLPLTGKQFDGIWHTSVVVHGTEHFFSQGLQSIEPLSSSHGVPVKTLQMGTTSFSQPEIATILLTLAATFTDTSYHIVSNNCNHFSDALLRKICDGVVPKEIMSLAEEVMATPFGAMVAPMFERIFTGKRKEVDCDEVKSELNGLMGRGEAEMIFGAIQSALDK